jgi:hypothetical protein
MGVKSGLSHEGRNVGWSVYENRTLKELTGCWENYLVGKVICAGFFKMLVPVEWVAKCCILEDIITTVRTSISHSSYFCLWRVLRQGHQYMWDTVDFFCNDSHSTHIYNIY